MRLVTVTVRIETAENDPEPIVREESKLVRLEELEHSGTFLAEVEGFAQDVAASAARAATLEGGASS